MKAKEFYWVLLGVWFVGVATGVGLTKTLVKPPKEPIRMTTCYITNGTQCATFKFYNEYLSHPIILLTNVQWFQYTTPTPSSPLPAKE